MTARPSPDLTKLLLRAREDRAGAFAELMPLVLAELRRIAGVHMKGERADHTLDPTALVHEAYMRLVDQQGLRWQDRAEFLSVAAHVMRQVLVDHAREKRALKRGGDRARVTLREETAEGGDFQVDVLDLHEKLEEFRATQERRARVVELRFFGGLTFEEVGYVLDRSASSAQDDWTFARAWLRRELRADREESEDREDAG